MTLSWSVDRLSLSLDRPFTISRGTTARADTLVVRLSDGEGRVGVGGGAPSAYYGETAATCEAVLLDYLDAVCEAIDAPDGVHDRQRIETAMRDVARGNPAARAAVETALWDLAGKRLGVPCYRLLGLDPDAAPRTCFSVGIDDPDAMAEAASEAVAEGFGTLKLKVGTDRDEARVRAVREAAPEATLRVDANGAWSAREAVRATKWLADCGVEFVEQPVAASDREGLGYVNDHGAVPVAVDESCVTASDVPRVADRTDIVVVKLAKSGGIGPARRAIEAARAHDLDVMIGCMVASNAAIAPACHLAPLTDYADLDGSLLLAEDPYAGVPLPDGRIALGASDRSGTGARRRDR